MKALINNDDADTGFDSPPRTMMPYSVSMPQTFGSAMTGRYPRYLADGPTFRPR